VGVVWVVVGVVVVEPQRFNGCPYHTIVEEETDGNDALAFKILHPVHSDTLHVKFPDILHLCISILWV
jgi:hypothetical protein